MIDAEDVALVEPLGEQAIERQRAVEVLTEGLLDHDLAFCREPCLLECRDRNWKDGRGQREIDRDRALTGYARRHIGRISEIELPVTRRSHQGGHRVAVRAGRIAP